MDDLLRMRRADFWTSLIFFGIAAGMIGSAMTMPLKESFAGVQNAWYVSPALFPLMIAGGLVILATTLLRNAIRTGGACAALASVGGWVEASEDATARMCVAIAIIAGYVYGFIPRVDYVIATALFLQVFIAAFYVGRKEVMRLQTAVYLFVAIPAFLTDLLGFYPQPGTPLRNGVDLSILLIMVGLGIATWRRVAADAVLRWRLATSIVVSIVVALLTSVSFKFGLLVPLPAEGPVVRALETVAIALRKLGS
jgi:putative tricarboxylic transport membrane protein